MQVTSLILYFKTYCLNQYEAYSTDSSASRFVD
nr:MAG TPA: hypothetical protein [Caudoviricetes sp.]